MEEFEKAVRLSYRKHGDVTKLERHRQFIDAIENQILCVEASLREYFIEEGKQPLKWVNLNEEECDDLAAFLSGTTPTIRGPKDENPEPVPSFEESIHETCNKRREASSNQSSLDIGDKVEEIQDARFGMKLQDNEISRSRDDVVCHTERTTNGRRVWSSPNFDTLTIVIPDEDERRNPMPTVEPTPKEKGSRTILWRQTGREFLPAKIAGHACSQVNFFFLWKSNIAPNHGSKYYYCFTIGNSTHVFYLHVTMIGKSLNSNRYSYFGFASSLLGSRFAGNSRVQGICSVVAQFNLHLL